MAEYEKIPTELVAALLLPLRTELQVFDCFQVRLAAVGYATALVTTKTVIKKMDISAIFVWCADATESDMDDLYRIMTFSFGDFISAVEPACESFDVELDQDKIKSILA